MKAAGGQVFRRTHTEVAITQFDHDIDAVKAEVREFEAKASHASGAAKTKLQAKLAQAKTNLDSAAHR
jgi:hypothetical protein